MRFLILIALGLFFTSCSSGESFNRGYVISKSPIENENDDSSAEEP